MEEEFGPLRENILMLPQHVVEAATLVLLKQLFFVLLALGFALLASLASFFSYGVVSFYPALLYNLDPCANG